MNYIIAGMRKFVLFNAGLDSEWAICPGTIAAGNTVSNKNETID